MQAYGGANLVPIAVPEICWNMSLLLNTNSAILIKSSVGMFFERLLSSLASGITPTTSAVTSIALSGIHPKVFLFFQKLPESLM